LQVGDLWAAMICEEMLRQEEAAAASSDGAGPAMGSAQEAAAACVAYGMLSEFAADFGALLAGLAAAPEQRAGLLAYLQANRMHACQRLLVAAGEGLGAGAGAAGCWCAALLLAPHKQLDVMPHTHVGCGTCNLCQS
jgi:hypothetical protein